ncbi:hypothetical protein, partial [Arthrobacter sp. JCM 19049]|uniref:hypothetical protein n=1 Tax=Arthrobacter sp. JCM 19049 TaxID=1460643 RepID=UPI002436AE13
LSGCARWATAWDSVGNYAVLGVALVMLFWRPPQNFEGVTAVPRHPVRACAITCSPPSTWRWAPH